MAGEALHGGLKLSLKQSHYDGLVEQLVLAPGQVGCPLVLQVVVVLLLVPLAIISLTRRGMQPINAGAKLHVTTFLRMHLAVPGVVMCMFRIVGPGYCQRAPFLVVPLILVRLI